MFITIGKTFVNAALVTHIRIARNDVTAGGKFPHLMKIFTNGASLDFVPNDPQNTEGIEKLLSHSGWKHGLDKFLETHA